VAEAQRVIVLPQQTATDGFVDRRRNIPEQRACQPDFAPAWDE